MSFILDALRKSELERQRDSAPGLMRSPVATVRREMPAWSWLLIVLLTLALVGVAAAWWLRNSDTGVALTAEEPLMPAAAPATTANSAAVTATEPTPSETSATTAAPVGAAAAPASSGEPKSMADLVRADPSLPRYALNFLAYNGANPDSSSASINGRRYFPGQVIEGGPELVGIRPDGAVLAYRGQTYLLTAR